MNTRCEDVSAHLMELLYQELPEGERAALQAHVDGCDRCRAELGSFQKTRAAARAVLDGPAPSAVRQRLVAAAMARVAEAQAQAVPRAAAPRATGGGFWQRLRGRWTLPTLATVGAMAVFLLASRVFLSPEAPYLRQRGAEPAPSASAPAPREPLAPAPAAPSELAPVEPPAPASAPAQRAHNDESPRRRRVPAFAEAPEAEGPSMKEPPSEAAPAVRAKRAAAPAKGGGSSAGAPPADKANPFPGSSDDLLGGVGLSDRGGGARAGTGGLRAAPAAKPSANVRMGKKASTDNLLEGLDGRGATREQAAAQEAETENALRRAEARMGVARGSLDQEGPAAAAPQPSPVPAPVVASAPPAAPARAHREFNASASAAAPKAESKAESKKRAAPEAEEDSAPSPAMAPLSSEESTARPSASRESLPQRAERLFKEERWSEAILAFEQLTRLYPKSALLSHWRQRISAARTQLTPPPPP